MDRWPARYAGGIGLVLLALAFLAFALVAFGVEVLGMSALEQLGAGLALATLARIVP